MISASSQIRSVVAQLHHTSESSVPIRDLKKGDVVVIRMNPTEVNSLAKIRLLDLIPKKLTHVFSNAVLKFIDWVSSLKANRAKVFSFHKYSHCMLVIDKIGEAEFLIADAFTPKARIIHLKGDDMIRFTEYGVCLRPVSEVGENLTLRAKQRLASRTIWYPVFMLNFCHAFVRTLAPKGSLGDRAMIKVKSLIRYSQNFQFCSHFVASLVSEELIEQGLLKNYDPADDEVTIPYELIPWLGELGFSRLDLDLSCS